MRMPKIIIVISLVTCWALSHVYLQTEIIKLGYQIKDKEDVFQEFADNNRVLKHNVFALESPCSFENNLLLADSSMQMLNPSQVLNLYSATKKEVGQEQEMGFLKNPMFLAIRKIFSGKPAEAKPIP